ncbi:shikimate dehydrogenase [Candidatus Poriferisodalis sp.]|uniref:shikimate dehydrogenase n=1 Tax=Candidatus Poriferisodalis sp. TaxID=3101277 RepID=UPI003B516B1C
MSDEEAHQRPSGRAESMLRPSGRAESMLRPSGRTKVAGVIGDPVQHSLSPALHNAAFTHLGLDWVYTAFAVPAGQGADAVAAMRVLGIEGLSVTMPHKDDVAVACDELSPAAALLGAANCVRRKGDRLIGENTDGDGFLASLRVQAGVEPAGMHAVVFGAGGAARAVIVALASQGASVTVVNRSADAAVRAAALGAAAGATAGVASSSAAMVGGPRAVRDADLVVNATPLGMSKIDPLPFDPALLRSRQIVADLIYRPERTPLLEAAASAGAMTLNGVGMLLYQAAGQFKMWTGRDAPIDVMAAAVGLELAG